MDRSHPKVETGSIKTNLQGHNSTVTQQKLKKTTHPYWAQIRLFTFSKKNSVNIFQFTFSVWNNKRQHGKTTSYFPNQKVAKAWIQAKHNQFFQGVEQRQHIFQFQFMEQRQHILQFQGMKHLFSNQGTLTHSYQGTVKGIIFITSTDKEANIIG